MTDFSESCVFCDSADDLNTIMTISIDDKDYKVAIGDSCEDEALPKRIKEALRERIEEHKKKQKDKESQLEKLKAAAAELGFELAPSGSLKLMIPVQATATPQATPKDLSNAPIIEQNGGKFVVQKNSRGAASKTGMNADQARSALEVARRESADSFPSSNAGQASEYQSHLLPESVQVRGHEGQKPEQISKINQVVPGRLGIPTTIPKRIVGTDGQTDIKIVRTGGDNLIQRRMKALNQVRMQAEAEGMAQPNDVMRTCISCNGDGDVKGKVCIRCQGNGFIGLV